MFMLSRFTTTKNPANTSEVNKPASRNLAAKHSTRGCSLAAMPHCVRGSQKPATSGCAKNPLNLLHFNCF
jgi:hypothetical protein